MKNSVRTGHEA